MSPSLTLGSQNSSNEDILKVGLIGVGLRGTNHLNNLLYRKDVIINSICDVDPNRIKIALTKILAAGKKKPKIFGSNDYDYRNLLNLKKY